jgi:superfamily II DNA/RNA helicase
MSDTNDNNALDNEEDDDYTIKTWDDLDIDISLLRGIYSYGFEVPSPIQCKAIKPIMSGRDVIAQAQSGTGKTATFTIGALSMVNTKINATQVLCLSPTRELSIQTAAFMREIGNNMENLKVQVLVGGNSLDDDINNLKNNTPQVITGCPGRIFDMLKRRQIKSQSIKLLIIDEADEMFSDGFKEQIYDIFKYLNSDIQVILFSATIPEHIFTIISKITRNPKKIIVKTEQLTLKGIQQYYVAIEDDEQKYSTLKDLYGFLTLSQCIIYANSVNRVIKLYDAMTRDKFPVCCIHSNMDKSERDRAFNEFKSGASRVLISSNVTARGIDIQQVSTVINFDIPKDVSTYLHRIGRSGRWGRKGMGINLITLRDVPKLKEIEQYYATEINELPSNFSAL